MSNFAPESATPVLIEEVVITSAMNPIKIDIANTTVELEIYEHIDKPYTTGLLSFMDGDRVMSSLNVSGAETVDIKIKANTIIAKSRTARFYIDRIITTKKSNESNEMILLHLTEEINYHSNLQNVNSAYSGTPAAIMSTIASDFLNTKFSATKKPPQATKVIIPNLTPLNAMCWIKNKLCTEKGYPFYMFSHFGGDGLYMVDLKTMIDRPAINKGKPYLYSQAVISAGGDAPDPTVMRRVMLDYQVNNTENLYNLIDQGMIGATHQSIDVTKNTKFDHKHDMNKVVQTMAEDNLIKRNPLFSEKYKLGTESYNKIQSRHISQITSTEAFEGFNSYGQSPTNGEYKLNSTQRALDSLFKKQPLDIKVNGLDFIEVEGNNTIGNKIEIKFPANLNDEGNSSERFDTKKSGDYLIYSAKHIFTTNSYVVSLTCLKLSNGEV